MSTVRVKAKRRNARQWLKKIPKSLRQQTQVTRNFHALFAQELFADITKQFITKSRGGTDQDGVKWPPLKPQTKRSKARAISRIQANSAHQLTSKQLKTFQDTHQRVFAEARAMGWTRQQANDQANALAWQSIGGTGQVPINIRSGTLLQSLMPGDVTGNTYRPRKNQIFQSHPGSFTLGSEVSYASAVNAKRPLYPRNMSRLARQAGQRAINRLLVILGPQI